MDSIETCPQCAGALKNKNNRLVQDACGHKKCRLCLLNDEEFCKQCKASESDSITNNTKLSEAQFYCHTAVITYQKKSDQLNAVPKHVEVKGCLDKECVDVRVNQEDLPVSKVTQSGNKAKSVNKPEKKKSSRSQQPAIASHISYNSNSELYTCNVCNKSFSGRGRVIYHKYCNGERRPFVCDICNQGFVSKSHYATHLLSHQKLKPYKCTAAGCGKTFSERSKLNRHKSIHGTNRPFICQECGKTFKIKENLRTHALIHKEEKPYGCTECDLRFSHSSNLKKHMAVHTSEKAHMCDQCGKRYKLKWALTLHRRVHSKTRPNKCATCHKTFVHLKDLARHELIHAESKGFRCGMCGSTFRRKDNLNRHARNTHPGKKPQIIKCVDTPNAIKVITASPIPTPPPQPTKEVLPEEVPETIQPNTEVTTTPPPKEVQSKQPVHVPVKLAFKTPQFKSHYKMNNDFFEPKAENVSIYEKILKPRSETSRSSTITQNIPEVPKVTEAIFEPLTPFNAPSHYETSFDNKKHAVIKNIKFKLPDKYINLNTMSRKAMTTDGDIATTSVIVNSTGNQQQVI